MRNKITVIIITIFISSCGGGNSHFTEQLSNDFVFEFYGPTLNCVRSPKPNKIIYGKIIEYNFDDNFILIVQNPDLEAHRVYLATELRNSIPELYAKNTEDDRLRSETFADSIIQYDPYYKNIFAHDTNYWIILSKVNQTYGPLTKMEYLAKRKELKAPDDLKLEKENQ